jgi:two-component system chemotaxis sensor kinase CheA
MDQLLIDFLGEAEELVEVLAGDLNTLSKRRDEGRVRRDLVARIFRHVHTLKGSSSSLGLDSLAQTAHELETLLDALRLGRIAVDDAVLGILDDTISQFSVLLRSISRGESPATSRGLIDRIRLLERRSHGASALSPRASRALAAIPDEMARALTEVEERRLHEALGEGAGLFIVKATFDLATFDERFRDLSDVLNETGEVISTLPGIEGAAPDQINFRLLYATDRPKTELSADSLQFGSIEVTQLHDEGESDAESKSTDLKEVAQVSAESSIAPLTSLVRVEMAALDEVIVATRELFSQTMAALNASSGSAAASRDTATSPEAVTKQIEERFAQLEKCLLALRMVPIGKTFARAIRAGKSAARTVGKEIDFETKGAELLLDKSVADAIADPLLHLLRNAVDHGIEGRSERSASGKAERGRVTLEAIIDGHVVRMKVTDDGRGIDPAQVSKAANDCGILRDDGTAPDQDAVNLIFTPGVSTAESVSQVSGRGVGLDVVKRAVEELNGEILVKSEIGVGTTFELVLPATSG